MAVRGRPGTDQTLQKLDQVVQALHQRLGGLPDSPEADNIWKNIWLDLSFGEKNAPPEAKTQLNGSSASKPPVWPEECGVHKASAGVAIPPLKLRAS
jgi:hypothetical protein